MSKHNSTPDLYNILSVQQIFLSNYYTFLVFLQKVEFNALVTTSISLSKNSPFNATV